MKQATKPPFYIENRVVYGYYSLYGRDNGFIGQISGKTNAQVVVNALEYYWNNKEEEIEKITIKNNEYSRRKIKKS